MESFNNKLKEIGILELICISLLSIAFLGFFELDLHWGFVFFIIYFIFRTRKHINGLKKCAINLFSEISFKTWLLLVVTTYVFSLGSGIFLNETLISLFNILGSIDITYNILITLIMDILIVGILGPIIEELIFRVVLLNRLSKYLPMICAIILSSVIFMLFHPYQAQLSSFIFGVTLCIAYLISENVLVPITMHILNNLISIGVPYIPNITSIFDSQIFLNVIYILATISLIYILIFIYKGYIEYKSSNNNDNN